MMIYAKLNLVGIMLQIFSEKLRVGNIDRNNGLDLEILRLITSYIKS